MQQENPKARRERPEWHSLAAQVGEDIWRGAVDVEGRHLKQALTIVLAPLLIGLAAAAALALPDQTREIYRVFARDYVMAGVPGGAGWSELGRWALDRLAPSPIGLAWIGVTAAGVLNWVLARNLTLLFAREHLGLPNAHGLALRWLPRLAGALIPLGAGLGMLLAAREVHKLPFDVIASPATPRQVDAAASLRLMGGFFLAIAAALVAGAWLRTRNKRYKYQQASRWLFSAPVVVCVIALTVGLVVLFATPLSGSHGVRAAWWLGTPALVSLFTMLAAYFATGLSIVSQKREIPVIALLAVYVTALALSDINDNHVVRVTPSETAASRPATREAFLAWYRNRADREVYERAGKPYPVFLVTAAGGGLYAADFAATGLARLQDGCPAFAQHIFAISGVSGGALGAAMFTTLLDGTPQVTGAEINPADPCAAARAGAGGPSLEERVGQLVTNDYLAPVVAAGLFTDFPQRFLPVPIPALDRSRAFEATLDTAWQRVNPGCTGPRCSPFADAFLSSWRPTDRAPALVLNTTNVDIGYRTIIAPFAIARRVPGEYSALQSFHAALAGRSGTGGDVSLGTAIGLSARFPWLMPAGTVKLGEGRPKMRLLDGGIFENSGVDTLADMMGDLAELERPPASRAGEARAEPWIEIHPIVMSSYQLNKDSRDSGLKGELLSPVSAMLTTRVQRAGMASYRLFLQRGYACARPGQSEACTQGGLRFLVLNYEDFRLPLGWQLSPFTRSVVKHHVGRPEACDPIPRIRDMFTGPSFYQRQQYTVRENNCTACAIGQTLKGQSLIGARCEAR